MQPHPLLSTQVSLSTNWEGKHDRCLLHGCGKGGGDAFETPCTHSPRLLSVICRMTEPFANEMTKSLLQ